MSDSMTKAEFEHGYADMCGLSVDRLRSYGLEARECDCGGSTCNGWQMTGVTVTFLARLGFSRRDAEALA